MASIKMSSVKPNSPEENLNQKSQTDSSQNEDSASSIGLFQTVLSIFAAVFGVQSEEKHKRDFEKGDATNFILGGIIFVILFIVTIYFIVGMVLEQAGVS